MKCHMCDNELAPDSFSTWSIGGRKMVVHNCKDDKCSYFLSTVDRMQIELVKPDDEVVGYTIVFQIKGKWYRVYSHCGAPAQSMIKPMTIFFYYPMAPVVMSPGYKESDILFRLERFMPLKWDEPTKPQLEVIIEKLKTLLLFS